MESVDVCGAVVVSKAGAAAVVGVDEEEEEEGAGEAWSARTLG